MKLLKTAGAALAAILLVAAIFTPVGGAKALSTKPVTQSCPPKCGTAATAATLSTSDLQALINTLLAQIAALTAQLNALRGGGTPPTLPPITDATTTTSGPALSISLDPSSVGDGQATMGSVQVPLATVRFTSGSAEMVKMTDLTVHQVAISPSTAKASFSSLTLYNGSSVVGTAGAPTVEAAGGYKYVFHFASPVFVPQNGSIALMLRADVPSYASGAATDNSTHAFLIGATDPVAFGASSNLAAAVSGGMKSNQKTVLRTSLTVTASPIGMSSNRSPVTVDNIASLGFTASPAGSLALNSVQISIGGSLLTSAFAAPQDIQLYDPATGMSVGSAVSTACGGGSCLATFSFGSGANGYVISAGSSKNLQLRIDSFDHTNATGAQTFYAQIANATNVSYTDAVDGNGATGLGLTPGSVPLSIANLVYGASGATPSSTLACAPNAANVAVGAPATFTATGSNGSYVYWSTFDGNPASGSGTSFTTYFASTGTKTVTAYVGNTSAKCSVNVAAGTMTTSTPPVTPTITVTYPQAGNILDNSGAKANIATITWTSAGTLGLPIEIDLMNPANGVIVKHVALNLSNTGSYLWPVDPSIGNGNYQVWVITQAKEGTPGVAMGRSGTFTLTGSSPAPVKVTVTAPLQGDSYTTGNPLYVRWTPTTGGVAAITLAPQNGGGEIGISGMKVFGDPVNYSGSFTFTNTSAVTPGKYTVRLYNPESYVNGGGAGTIIGESGTFSINASVPTPPNTGTAPTITSIGAKAGGVSQLWAGQPGFIVGTGFLGTNTLTIDNWTATVSSADGKNITFTAPNLAPGVHVLNLKNANGSVPYPEAVTFFASTGASATDSNSQLANVLSSIGALLQQLAAKYGL